jgi:GTP pyrophosphokinase
VGIEGRIKRLFSIRQKIKRQRIGLEQVYDLVALRVITKSVKDCYATLGIIHQTWAPVPGRFKDFVAMPRPNAYQSLHTSVVSDRGFPFEVQIRTERMHSVAEEGIAAHWKYKEGRVGAKPDEQYFVWLRQLLEWQQEVRDPSEFIHSLKVDLYPEEVYTFTPKGEVKALPRGATPVDFAYAIHTDVGHTCVGARVNGRMVPLRTRLQSGDIVEVVTASGHTPSRDWQSFVATSRARNKIKHVINAEENVRAVDLGRKLLDKEVRRFDLSGKKVLDPGSLAKISGEFGVKKGDDLLAAVGYGKISARKVLAKLVPQDRLREKTDETAIAAVVRRVFRPSEDKIKVRGFDDLMVFRARCCNPIRGEKIVGYITRGKGVSVHAATCPNVVNLLYDPERRIDVVWDKADAASSFTVCLAIQVEDRRGILADVTGAIANVNINMRKVEASTNEDQRGRISVTMDITDLKHLQRVSKVVRAVPGVVDVERVMR